MYTCNIVVWNEKKRKKRLLMMISEKSRVQGIVFKTESFKKISSSTEILHCSCFLNVFYKDLWLGYIFPKRLMRVSSGILEIFQESSSSSHSLFLLIHKLVQRELKCIPPLPSLHLRMHLTTKLCCKLSFAGFFVWKWHENPDHFSHSEKPRRVPREC